MTTHSTIKAEETRSRDLSELGSAARLRSKIDLGEIKPYGDYLYAACGELHSHGWEQIYNADLQVDAEFWLTDRIKSRKEVKAVAIVKRDGSIPFHKTRMQYIDEAIADLRKLVCREDFTEWLRNRAAMIDDGEK